MSRRSAAKSDGAAETGGALFLDHRTALLDANGDVEPLRTAADTRAAHGRCLSRITSDRDTHVLVRRADAVGRIKGNPAETRHVHFGPGVAGLLIDAVRPQEVAADIACGMAESARGREQDVREVLADAAFRVEASPAVVSGLVAPITKVMVL